MINTKRQIRNDRDRFGGYYMAESSGLPYVSGLEPIAATPKIDGGSPEMSDLYIGDISARQPVIERKLYSTRDDAQAVAERPMPVAQPLPKRQKTERSHEKEDLLPTIKTRACATEKTENETKPAASAVKRERKMLDTRTKVLLGVYVIIALILAIAVIATGVSISAAEAQSDKLAEQISVNRARIAVQEDSLRELVNDEVIRERAEGLGMVQAPIAAVTVKNAETVGYPEATPNTDAFDKFCDWMSKVFG